MAYGPVGFRHRDRYRIRCVPLLSFRVGCVGGLSPKRLTQRQGGGGGLGALCQEKRGPSRSSRAATTRHVSAVMDHGVWSTTEIHRTEIRDLLDLPCCYCATSTNWFLEQTRRCQSALGHHRHELSSGQLYANRGCFSLFNLIDRVIVCDL